MALKTKLFLAFFAMAILSVITAGIAVYAFRQTNRTVEKTGNEVDYVAGSLIPTSDKWMNISAQIISAGLEYTTYAYGFAQNYYDKANNEVATVEKELAELDAILATAGGRLPESVEAARKCRQSVTELKAIGAQFNVSCLRLKELNIQFVDTLEQISTIADEQYNVAYTALKEVLQQKGVDAGEVEKRSARVEFLSGVFDCVAWGNRDFWRAQSLRGDEAEKYYGESRQQFEDLIALVDEYNTPENVPDKAEQELFAKIQDISKRLNAISTDIGTIFQDLAVQTVRLGTISDEASATVRNAAQFTSKQVLASAESIRSETTEITLMGASSEQRLFIATICALGIGFILAYCITRGIVNPIGRILGDLHSGETVIADAVGGIARASRQLADGAEEQSSALEESSSALEEIASMAKVSAENAQRTDQQTGNVVGLIKEGSQSMEKMAGAMAEINERSEKVGQIIKTIEDIAFQTNLLALNAAVEAARAGEAGKGFAVVADEVRNLSQRSAAAARDTTVLIQGTVHSIQNGSQIADHLVQSYNNIDSGTSGIGNLIRQISQASIEQSDGIEQVNNAVAQMDKITQRNSESSGDIAAASDGLSDQLKMLSGAIRNLSEMIYGGARPLPRAENVDKRGKGERRNVAAATPRRSPQLPVAQPRQPSRPPAASAPAIMRPDQVIPLEGDGSDFGDF